jgi:hypothetical protein
MSTTQDDSRTGKHAQAVANSLSEADQAAGLGQYADALGWLETLRAIGEDLPDEYELKRAAWMDLLSAAREQPRPAL